MRGDQTMKINDILTKAQNELGVSEYPANSNNVKYNTWFYGHLVQGKDYPWCAVFISYLFKDEPTLLKKTASCVNMLEWCEAHNLIVKDPQPGDIVFFKYATNRRRTNHVGLVVDVQNTNNFTTIEGNTSTTSNDNGGRVMERKRARKNVVGFARPRYSDLKDYKPTLRKGSKGESVELLQSLLNLKIDANLIVDSDFGPATKEAVINFQMSHGLKADGIVGPKTWEKLLK